jgi:hypothetical protein
MDQEYRMSKVNAVSKFLEKEIEDRQRLYKNYKRGYNILHSINTTASLISLGTGIGGIATLPVPLAPVILGSLAIGSGFVAASSSIGNKILLKKLEKHEQIMTLAQSKLNSISNILSKALNDSAIDEREFELIVQEYEKYLELKNAIRNTTRTELKIYSENIKQKI